MKRVEKAVLVILVVVLSLLMVGWAADVLSYPEKYLSTWRYQLKCDIDRGNEMAIEYYEDNYTSKGIYLFGEN